MRFKIRLTVGALALAFAPTLALAQAATVTGRITAADRGAVSDVAVTIPQLGVGTVTREDGRYVITIPGARVTGQLVTLTARRIGYRAMSVQITLTPGTVAQDLTLGANPLQLGEVVVTGAGTTSTVERLGSVRNVVAPELIVKANEPNLVQALAGKAPNVEVAQSSGDPGASSRIQIRGLRTLNGSIAR